MRQQAMENLLIEFEKAVDELENVWYERGSEFFLSDFNKLSNLASKSAILRDRSDRSASVIKELVNK
jgi:hypothetical protein